MTKSGRELAPASLRFQITRQVHNRNHWGYITTYNNIAKNFYWSGKRYIRLLCSECDVCLKCKYPNHKPGAALNPIPWDTYKPRDYVTMDLATMSKTHDELHYILVMVDGVSKYLEITPLKDITSDLVINGIKRDWIGRHGTPQKT